MKHFESNETLVVKKILKKKGFNQIKMDLIIVVPTTIGTESGNIKA